ncbi:TlpA disulfide reductase family protein [Pedobacter africanus]|uniref:Thiol-disulfide isomerase or thioredoxin n=1 Tax=Pedobacter africanus TaxID=151894 RepID=A0A1W1YWV6_9SPHI|nr:TlpA disulfide reductase family protein [Pedobacter africanus]SMC40188.1 Thiol-disulfide isomerase or thioredoxin [Pedobacter africanus]
MKSIKMGATLVLLLLSILTNAAVLQQGYHISGIFTGLQDGTVLELIPAGTHDDEKAVANAVVKAGKFSFKGAVEGPRLFRISVKGNFGGCQLMVNNTNISVTAKAALVEQNGAKFLDLKGLKITGSPVHEEYLKKVVYREMLNRDYEAYHKSGEDIVNQISAAKNAKDSVKVSELMKSPAYLQFAAEEKAFFDKVAKTSTDLITANKDSWWGAFLMLNAYSYFTPEQKPLFESLSATAKNSYYGRKIKDELFPKGFLNQKAPVFEAVSSAKKDAALGQLIKGHKYTLVDFWASWCAPCRKSIPALKALYEEMNSKGLQIVSISIDKKESDWLKAEQEENLKWPSFLDKGATAAAWKIRAIPAMFLLDEKGVVVAENLNLEQLKAKLKENI